MSCSRRSGSSRCGYCCCCSCCGSRCCCRCCTCCCSGHSVDVVALLVVVVVVLVDIVVCVVVVLDAVAPLSFSIYQSIYLALCLFVSMHPKEASLRDYPSFCTQQNQK